MAIAAIIPARFASTRLPGKPLADILGRPMIQWVCERASAARCVDRLIVATDDERIATAVRSFGTEAVLTSPDHPSGTDRLAEVAATLPSDIDIIVNVQGDEPTLDPHAIELVCSAFEAGPEVVMTTLAIPLRTEAEMLSPDVVKVVTNAAGDALYFSRAPIPHLRVHPPDAQASARRAVSGGLPLRHVGLYAYRKQTLRTLASLPPAPLEQAECLEQLRALHHGIPIRVVRADLALGVAVDTAEDLVRARDQLSSPGGMVGPAAAPRQPLIQRKEAH